MHFKIYQLAGDCPRFNELVFQPWRKSEPVDLANYCMTYAGSRVAATQSETLAHLSLGFTISRHSDFIANTLSTSDIVQLDGRTVYYRDLTGWVELTPGRCDGVLR